MLGCWSWTLIQLLNLGTQCLKHSFHFSFKIVFSYVYVHVHTCAQAHVEIKRQLVEVCKFTEEKTCLWQLLIASDILYLSIYTLFSLLGWLIVDNLVRL